MTFSSPASPAKDLKLSIVLKLSNRVYKWHAQKRFGSLQIFLINIECSLGLHVLLFLLQRKGVITLKCDESKYPGNFSEFTETGSSSPFKYVSTLWQT